MSFFISDAHAQDAAQAAGPFELILPLLLMFAIFYFLLIRPQQKKQKEHQRLLTTLRPGDKVVTSGGVIGWYNSASKELVVFNAKKLGLFKTDVVAREEIPMSLMPPGLLLAFTPGEIRDLVAYLLNGS